MMKNDGGGSNKVEEVAALVMNLSHEKALVRVSPQVALLIRKTERQPTVALRA